jgi:hypothetical protein
LNERETTSLIDFFRDGYEIHAGEEVELKRKDIIEHILFSFAMDKKYF